MAVYFAPQRTNNVSVMDVLNTVAGGLINAMLQREKAAKQFNYDSRLASEAADRQAQATQLANEREDAKQQIVYNDLQGNKTAPVGTPALAAYGPAIGIKTDIKDVYPYVGANYEAVDQGGQKSIIPVFGNGTTGERQVFDVSMSPKEQADSDLAVNTANFRQNIDRQKLDLDRAATNAKIAALKKRTLSSGSSGGGSWRYAKAGDGSIVMYDTRTGEVKPTQFNGKSKGKEMNEYKFLNDQLSYFNRKRAASMTKELSKEDAALETKYRQRLADMARQNGWMLDQSPDFPPSDPTPNPKAGAIVNSSVFEDKARKILAESNGDMAAAEATINAQDWTGHEQERQVALRALHSLGGK